MQSRQVVVEVLPLLLERADEGFDGVVGVGLAGDGGGVGGGGGGGVVGFSMF